MKLRGERRQILSFAVVFFIILFILFPLLTGVRHSLGIQETWQKAKSHWHHGLFATLSEKETGSESLTSLAEALESKNFQALIRFSRPLAAHKEALADRLRSLLPPYSLSSILEIERELDNITQELNLLSTQQISAFESLLVVSYLLIALLLILYGAQNKQLAIARKEKSLAAELTRISLEIHENERKKIARDLHDGLSQNIALARMSVDRLPGGNEKKQLEISLDHSFLELRKILFNLRSAEDFSGSLDELVGRECGQFQEKFGLEVAVLIIKPFRPSWNRDHFAQFFRILHEGLINVIRHSGTTRAEVSIDCSSGFVDLFIRDTGRGMSNTKPDFGIKGMKERTAILGGTIKWNSSPGKGTEIHLSVPEVLS